MAYALYYNGPVSALLTGEFFIASDTEYTKLVNLFKAEEFRNEIIELLKSRSGQEHLFTWNTIQSYNKTRLSNLGIDLCRNQDGGF